jgi:hypothetical protein
MSLSEILQDLPRLTEAERQNCGRFSIVTIQNVSVHGHSSPKNVFEQSRLAREKLSMGMRFWPKGED